MYNSSQRILLTLPSFIAFTQQLTNSFCLIFPISTLHNFPYILLSNINIHTKLLVYILSQPYSKLLKCSLTHPAAAFQLPTQQSFHVEFFSQKNNITKLYSVKYCQKNSLEDSTYNKYRNSLEKYNTQRQWSMERKN